jgi:hypothetical protein
MNHRFILTVLQNIGTAWQGQGGDRSWGFGEYALGFAVSPTDPARVIIADMGTVHMTTNGGTRWAAVYVRDSDVNPANASTPKGLPSLPSCRERQDRKLSCRFPPTW